MLRKPYNCSAAFAFQPEDSPIVFHIVAGRSVVQLRETHSRLIRFPWVFGGRQRSIEFVSFAIPLQKCHHCLDGLLAPRFFPEELETRRAVQLRKFPGIKIAKTKRGFGSDVDL